VRLPWPLGRRTPSDGPSPGMPAEAPGPASPAPAPSPPAPADTTARPTGAWRSLPPIQRASSAPPLVAPAAPFLADVPGHRPLPPIVGPLGHDLTPSAPAGLVVARPSAVPSLTASVPMPTRPLQRHASGSAAVEGTPAAGPETLPGITAGPWSPGSSSSSTSPAVEPVRHLATVTPAATVTPPSRPLTQAPPLTVVAQRSRGGSPSSPAQGSGAPAGPAGGPPWTAGAASPVMAAAVALGAGNLSLPPVAVSKSRPGVQRRWSEAASAAQAPVVGLGAPITGSSPTPASGSAHAPGASDAASSGTSAGQAPAAASAGVPMTASPSPAMPATATPLQATPVHADTPGGPRRTGLGAPLSGPLPVAQRIPIGLRRRPGEQASASITQAGTANLDLRARASSGPASAPARSLPVLPVSRMAAGSPSTAGASTPAAAPAPARAHVPLQLPTLGTRPLRTSVDLTHDGDASPDPASPVPAVWSAVGSLPGTVTTLPNHGSYGDVQAVPLQHLDEAVPVQRLDAAQVSAARASAARATSAPGAARDAAFPAPAGRAHPWTMPFPAGQAGRGGSASGGAGVSGLAAVQRSAGPGTPTLRQSSSHGASRGASSGAASLSLAHPHAAAPSVNRIVASPASAPVPAPAVQTSTARASAGLPAFSATPVVQRVDGAAPAAPDGGGAHSDSELDQLAKALFPRIKNHLRAEVIHEREAKGLTFDAF